MSLILFPHQLFDKKYIKEYKNVYLVEHPIFYGERKMKMNFNKKKIILHHASCLYYKNYAKVQFINYETFKKSKYDFIKDETDIYIFDPCDYELEYDLYETGKNINYLDTPSFMSSHQQLLEYFQSKGEPKRVSHSAFYNHQLKIHNIPHITKSYDTENRNSIPENTIIPSLPSLRKSDYITQSISWCEKTFPKNYGTTDDFNIPITHKQAKEWLSHFLKHKLSVFGKYQDAMIPKEPYLFHSLLSPLLNIGLLTPKEVIDSTIKYYETHKIDIQDMEAFIRQIIGWREYQRFLYMFYEHEMRSSNIFGHKRQLSSVWYSGNTGIDSVDDSIKQAWNTGYLHHIQRLMIMSNIMNLCEIDPNEVYKWFMEFSIDSYDWVMVGNVYSMGMWADGGLSMRKPYISTGNYIETMSGGRWKADETWRSLYYVFIDKHEKILRGTPYIRNLSYWKKIGEKERENMKSHVKSFIKKLK
jgi:deoxyribodipyrimidine photolyase-related protein